MNVFRMEMLSWLFPSGCAEGLYILSGRFFRRPLSKSVYWSWSGPSECRGQHSLKEKVDVSSQRLELSIECWVLSIEASTCGSYTEVVSSASLPVRLDPIDEPCKDGEFRDACSAISQLFIGASLQGFRNDVAECQILRLARQTLGIPYYIPTALRNWC